MAECAILPPDFEHVLAGGSACPLPEGHGETHRTTVRGETFEWNGFDCAYPEDCQYDGGECCVTFGRADDKEAQGG